eukprot:768453-Hanusia_phi.AAC.4
MLAANAVSLEECSPGGRGEDQHTRTSQLSMHQLPRSSPPGIFRVCLRNYGHRGHVVVGSHLERTTTPILVHRPTPNHWYSVNPTPDDDTGYISALPLTELRLQISSTPPD